jgi:hypothetical protein
MLLEQVTVVTPVLKLEPDGGEQVIVPQTPSPVGAGYVTTVELAVVTTNTSDGQAMLLQLNTSNVAVAVEPAPPSLELTAPVVLVFKPCVVALTLTLIEQLPPAVAIAPPDRLTLVAAATAVNAPPQVLVAIGVASTSRPAGKGSLMLTPVTPPGLIAGLAMVIVNVDVVLSKIEFGENDFVTVTGAKTRITTSSVEATHGALLIVQRKV